MAKEDAIQLEGSVTEVLPNATFRVQLTNGHNVLATLGGNMRRFRTFLSDSRQAFWVNCFSSSSAEIVRKASRLASVKTSTRLSSLTEP